MQHRKLHIAPAVNPAYIIITHYFKYKYQSHYQALDSDVTCGNIGKSRIINENGLINAQNFRWVLKYFHRNRNTRHPENVCFQ